MLSCLSTHDCAVRYSYPNQLKSYLMKLTILSTAFNINSDLWLQTYNTSLMFTYYKPYFRCIASHHILQATLHSSDVLHHITYYKPHFIYVASHHILQATLHICCITSYTTSHTSYMLHHIIFYKPHFRYLASHHILQATLQYVASHHILQATLQYVASHHILQATLQICCITSNITSQT